MCARSMAGLGTGGALCKSLRAMAPPISFGSGLRVAAFATALIVTRQAQAAPVDCKHEVVAGDTTSAIAAAHGLGQRELVALNPALQKDPDKLRLGQVLKVCTEAPKTADGDDDAPAPAPKRERCGTDGNLVRHEVASGDTLAKIALEYDVRERDIVARNRRLQADPNKLALGQKLEICVEAPAKHSRADDDDRPSKTKIVKAKECGGETPLFVHEVVPGEHLGSIAGRYGVRKSDLLRLNAGLRANPDMLSVGKRIRVCPEIAPRIRSEVTHVVRKGETLGAIALQYELSPTELFRYQRGKLPDRNALREGQKLVVWVDGKVVPGFGGRDVDTGILRDGVQLMPGKHYMVKWEAGAWGTSKTVRAIQQAVSDYRKRVSGGPKIHIGDISKRSGGKFPPHLSHQHGRDVDIGYVLTGKDAHETKFRHAGTHNLDVPRTWALIKSFVDTDEVTYIFMDYRIQKLLYEHALSKGVDEDTLDELFQYPRGRGRSHGIIRHWRGHANHFHVRFRP